MNSTTRFALEVPGAGRWCWYIVDDHVVVYECLGGPYVSEVQALKDAVNGCRERGQEARARELQAQADQQRAVADSFLLQTRLRELGETA